MFTEIFVMCCLRWTRLNFNVVRVKFSFEHSNGTLLKFTQIYEFGKRLAQILIEVLGLDILNHCSNSSLG